MNITLKGRPRKREVIAHRTALLLPRERVGVRGRFHRLRLAERPLHPARKSAPTSPRIARRRRA
jgi:hypothetical protein